MDWITFLKFSLIALALPAQYYISQNWSSDFNQQQEALRNVINSVKQFKTSYLELQSWKKWYFSFFIEQPREYKGGKLPNWNKVASQKVAKLLENIKKVRYDDDVAVEVLNYRKKLVNFGESSEIRSPRPPNIRFKVGQVVKHKKLNLYGVIIGWDNQAFAPDDWIALNYELSTRENYVHQPHYLILVDEKHQNEQTGKAYIAQDLLDLVVNNEVKNRLLSSFFNEFDGGQYLPKKYLKTVYPND